MADGKGESEVVSAVKAALAEIYPNPLPPPHVEALRRPLDLSDKKPPANPPKDPPRMTESNGYANGQYREIRADVDNLKGNFADLRHDVTAWRNELSLEMRELGKSFTASFDGLRTSQARGGLDISKLATVASVILTLVYFYSTQNQKNTDNVINFTNDRITTSNAVVKDNFASQSASILGVAAAVQKLQDTTISKSELDNRIGRNERELNMKQPREVAAEVTLRHDKEIAKLGDDVERLKTEAVNRSEFETSSAALSSRLDLISNRVCRDGQGVRRYQSRRSA